MVLPPLADAEDFQARLGRVLEDLEVTRVERLLQDASGRVRREAGGQIITQQTSTFRLSVCCGRIDLPQVPVTAIGSVKNVDGDDVDITWETGAPTFTVVADSGTILVVACTHGFADLPDELVGIVCQMAGRAFGVPLDSAGVQSQTLGAYSYSTGSAAAQGAIGMLSDELDVARSYRKPRRPISML